MPARKPTTKRRSLGGKVLGKTDRSKSKKATRKDTGVVGSRGAAGLKSKSVPTHIDLGAAGPGTGRDRGTSLRGSMRTPLSWRDQLKKYYGESPTASRPGGS